MRNTEEYFPADRRRTANPHWNGTRDMRRGGDAASLTMSAPVSASAHRRKTGDKLHHNWHFFINCLRVADFGALFLAGCIANELRFGEFVPDSSGLLFLYFSAVATLVALQLAGSYRPRTLADLGNQLSALFVGGVGALMTVLIGGFVTGSSANYSRAWITGAVALGAVFLIGNRVAISAFSRHVVRQGHLRDRIVLVGVNEHAEKIIANLAGKAYSGARLLGAFDDRATRLSHSLRGCPVLGSVDELLTYVRSNKVDRVVVTLPWTSSDRIQWLLKKLRTVPVRVDLVPHDLIWQFNLSGMERLADIPIITIANRRIDEQSGLVKRIEDIALSALLLLLVSPVMLLIAIAIRLEGPGPILFRQKRHGFNNEVFEVFKFRSMRVQDAGDGVVRQATRDDNRITRVGRFLRRSSLDELPQLLNVLMGTMSVVGPRPHAVTHNIQYAALIAEYFARHNVKPGITGWAQVNGLRGETDTEEKMRKRVEYDLYYIEHWSLLLDLKIVLMTAICVWMQENAY
ncbi:MAG: undecaprenyl-phosphate glucose phosphotransferase [Burkholderiaceae bacterium]